MMVNVDNTNSSSVGFGLEDLPLLNNNNNEAEAKSEDDIRSIDKVSLSKLMMHVQTRNINHERLRESLFNVF